jgi:hypothetical protein
MVWVPGSTVTPDGDLPTGTVAEMVRVDRSMTDTVASPRLVTYTVWVPGSGLDVADCHCRSADLGPAKHLMPHDPTDGPANVLQRDTDFTMCGTSELHQ